MPRYLNARQSAQACECAVCPAYGGCENPGFLEARIGGVLGRVCWTCLRYCLPEVGTT
jgi:hypothetical protein